MRYQYTSRGYLNSLKKNTPKGAQLLLIINIAVFLLMEFLLISNNYLHDTIFYNLALVPQDVYPKFYLWQCMTYLFLHGGIIHLLFNMLPLDRFRYLDTIVKAVIGFSLYFVTTKLL